MQPNDGELAVPLSDAAHPTRRARVAVRRFLAPRAIDLVQIASDLCDEAVREAVRTRAVGLHLSARLDERALRLELTDTNGRLAGVELPLATARALQWGSEDLAPGSRLWIEVGVARPH